MKKAGVSSALVAAVLLAVGLIAYAQHSAKIPWIGYLTASGSGPSPEFIQGLRDLGYVEGKNIAFAFRTVEGKRDRFSDLAAEIVRLKVDIIIADGLSPTLALMKATSTIPIVMTNSTDPVGTGLIASLARPGGNVTGLTNLSGELGGKVLDLLKEIVPKLIRVGILTTAGAVTDVFLKEAEVPARALKVQLIPVMVQSPDDFDGAFRAMTKERAMVLSYVSSQIFILLTSSGSRNYQWRIIYHRSPNILFGRMSGASCHTAETLTFSTAVLPYT